MHMSMGRPRRRFSRVAALATVALTALFAVEAASAQDAAADDKPAGGKIETVTVTAQKRKQNILDIGENVSAVSGSEVRDRGVEQVRDLPGYISNLDVKEQVPGAMPVISIRGVGLDDFSSTNNPAAGVYIDEVFLSSLALMSFDLYDLQRVEVIKGPQGTLYGRNSTAGAINVITARPSTDGFESFAQAGYGNYAAFDAQGMMNVPVSDTFAVRFAGRTIQQGEGFWFNRVTGDDVGERNLFSGRASAAWTPTNDISVDLKFDGMRVRSDMGNGEFFGLVGPTPPCPGAPSCFESHGYNDTDGDPFTGDWSGAHFYNIDQWGSTLKAEADLGAATLTSVTGYIQFERAFYTDTDATPFLQTDFIQSDKVKQVSQEVRLTGTSEGVADWLFGVFYSHDHVTVHTPGFHDDLFNTQTLTFADQETDSAAAFAHIEWILTDQLKLVTGLRYTWEEKSDVGGTIDVNNLYNTFFGAPAPGFGSCLLSPTCTPAPGAVTLAGVDTTISDTNWSWRIGLNWKTDEHTLLYASASQGTKSGGFFSGIATIPNQLDPYKPETLIAYEIGLKKQYSTFQFTGSAFYYDYSDVQTFIRDGVFPVQRLGNVDEATIYGADVDAVWKPEEVEGLTLQAGIGLLHTELGEFVSAAGIVPEGNKLPNAPDMTFNALARYDIFLGDAMFLSLQGDTHYSDAMFKDALNDPIIASDSYWIFNGRLALISNDDDWELAVWGKNLTDELYVTQGLNVLALGYGNRGYNAPRTYGVTLSKRFD